VKIVSAASGECTRRGWDFGPDLSMKCRRRHRCEVRIGDFSRPEKTAVVEVDRRTLSVRRARVG
jgi:hypothetical protein